MHGLAQIEHIKVYWKRLTNAYKFTDVNCYYKTKDKFMFEVDAIYNKLIINEKHSKLRM